MKSDKKISDMSLEELRSEILELRKERDQLTDLVMAYADREKGLEKEIRSWEAHNAYINGCIEEEGAYRP